MVKIDLITGFLGAGKTTFLLKYARHLINQGLKIGILEYDYGSINVDMMLISSLRCGNCEIEMLAAACDMDCLRRRFQTKLIAMAMSGYDRVIVEPSGVFDMDMFYDILRDEPLENWYEIGSVITVVNAGLDEYLSDNDKFVLASEAACAGCVVLSRTQCFDKDLIESTKARLIKAEESIMCRNLTNEFYEKNFDEYDEVDYAYFMNCGHKFASYQKKQIYEDEYESIPFLDIKETLEGMKKKLFTLFNDSSYGKVERIKGFLHDECNYKINATKYELKVEPMSIGKSILIVIGSSLNSDKIKALFEGRS